MMQILPSNYQWLIPPFDATVLDELAVKGLFPTIEGILLPALGYCFLFGVTRILFSSTLFKPLARYAMNISSSSFKPVIEIEQEISKFGRKKLLIADIHKLAKLSGKSEAEVNAYVMARTIDRTRKTKETKFVEALWRFVFYLGFIIMGCRILILPQLAEWIVDTRVHWVNWPHQNIPDLIKIYHQVQMGCYFHQLMWTEVNRSDSTEMIIHHITTILLVLISHLTCFYRSGSVTFFLHDLSDVFLESAKCFNYTSKVKGRKWASTVSDILFAIFALSFFVLRLVVYPKLIVYSVVVESRGMLGVWPGYYLISTLLSTLVCLHIFWFYLISKMIYKLLTTGIEKDERSDDEDEEDITADTSSSSSAGGQEKKIVKNKMKVAGKTQ